MARTAWTPWRPVRIAPAGGIWLVPGPAFADWGERWGEMLWGGSAHPIPSLPFEGLLLLALLLLPVSVAVLVRRRTRTRA